MQQNILKINVIDETAAVAKLTGNAPPAQDDSRLSLPNANQSRGESDLKASF